MRARRTIGALALASTTAVIATGCLGGGDDASEAPPAATAPAAAVPVAVAAVPPGGTVSAGPSTPAPVRRALAGRKVVVVAFVVDGPADDARVSAAVRAAKADRAVRAAATFFVYRVGKDDFGDLADLLGVTGTPSVAVIGRDRTLVNLWTGLTDADILRQSISDAAARAAADTAATGTAAGARPVGDPTGIALARTANAAYRDVPGVRVTGSFPVENVGTIGLQGVFRLSGGAVDGMSGTFTLGGARFEMVASATAASVRTGSARCWARLPGDVATAGPTPDPTFSLPPGARVSAPRRAGPNDLVDVSAGGQTLTYVIDRASSRLRAVRTAEGTLTFAALGRAPKLPDPSPVCDDPAEALTGLPAAFGGGS